MSTVHARTYSLEAKVARLEDINDIQALKVRYTEATDFGYKLDDIAACFTERGRWAAEGFADCHGRREIKEFFRSLAESVTMALHYTTNPRIELSGDGLTATGRFHLLCACTMRGEEPESREAVVMLGTYEDTFVKADGRWLIEELQADVRHVSGWTEGWARQPWRA